MSTFAEVIADLNRLNAFELARMADTHSPDSSESVGAGFLTRVRDSAVESITDTHETYPDFDGETLGDWLLNNGSISEIADNAPSIYTHERFQQLVDLCAYQEDVSELAGDETDMEKLAGVALYMVAERLVNALLDRLKDFDIEDEA